MTKQYHRNFNKIKNIYKTTTFLNMNRSSFLFYIVVLACVLMCAFSLQVHVNIYFSLYLCSLRNNILESNILDTSSRLAYPIVGSSVVHKRWTLCYSAYAGIKYVDTADKVCAAPGSRHVWVSGEFKFYHNRTGSSFAYLSQNCGVFYLLTLCIFDSGEISISVPCFFFTKKYGNNFLMT